MDTIAPPDPAAIRTLRAEHAKMRERDFARIHGISEAALVAAYVGAGTTRLNADVGTLLTGLEAVGEVMALTRNESVVHEKIGRYSNVSVGQHTGIVLGDEIDLRVFPPKWRVGFAVEKTDDAGDIRRSLQFFDAAGDAVHKVHLRPESDLAAYGALVERLRAADQSQALVAEPPAPSTPAGTPATPAELRDRWSRLTDTHQFHGMLKQLNLTRHQAVSMIEADYAFPLELGATAEMFGHAVAEQLPIMVFAGNRGCIQIHSGPVHNVAPMGPWLNVMDETFHLHLRLDQIDELWAVRKPTKDGHVTSIEAYGADRELIVQFFGVRLEGHDERPDWRRLVESLGRRDQSNAA